MRPCKSHTTDRLMILFKTQIIYPSKVEFKALQGAGAGSACLLCHEPRGAGGCGRGLDRGVPLRPGSGADRQGAASPDLPALVVGRCAGDPGVSVRGTGLRARHVLVLVQRHQLCARRESWVQAHADQHTDAVSGCPPAGEGLTRYHVRHPCHACKGLMSSAYGVWRF